MTVGTLHSTMASSMPTGSAFHELLTRQSGSLTFVAIDSSGMPDALEHSRAAISQIIRRGLPFYIGITEHPQRRWLEHCEQGLGMWARMDVLVQAPRSSITASLERQLLQIHRAHPYCTNVASGGERASAGSPHYLYVLVGQAPGLIRRRPPAPR